MWVGGVRWFSVQKQYVLIVEDADSRMALSNPPYPSPNEFSRINQSGECVGKCLQKRWPSFPPFMAAHVS